MASPRDNGRASGPFTLPSIAAMTQGMGHHDKSPQGNPVKHQPDMMRDSGMWSMQSPSKREFMSSPLHKATHPNAHYQPLQIPPPSQVLPATRLSPVITASNYKQSSTRTTPQTDSPRPLLLQPALLPRVVFQTTTVSPYLLSIEPTQTTIIPVLR